MRSVYLVGVNHKYQFGPNVVISLGATPEDFSKFRNFLCDLIARHRIQGIAEEMSLCALENRMVHHSFPRGLAEEVGLPHRYCDIQTQKVLPDEQRRPYWIQELIAFDTFPVLFILGAKHVDSFKDLLIESAFQPFVMARNWEPDPAR
jgi:hypothetical protein